MIFLGSYEYTLDNKGRVCLPSKLRCDETKVLYILNGFDGCIALYTEEGFKSFIDKLETFGFERAKARRVKRYFTSSAEKIETDASGRILIPKPFLNAYHITSKVMIVGVEDHLEIWDVDTWKKYNEQDDTSLEDIVESLAEDD